MKAIGSIMIGLILFLSACSKDNNNELKEPAIIKLPAKSGEVIQGGNDFGVDLFRLLAMEEDHNIMISPLSASTALTMLLNGTNGPTHNQIAEMLGYQNMTTDEINLVYQSLLQQLLAADPNVDLMLSNAVWYRNDFQVKPPFLASMQSNFKSHIEALDFNNPSSLTKINAWASDNTKGKIDKVLDEISPDAVMFIMNALYFKGAWTYIFDKSQTKPALFFPEEASPFNVQMMNQSCPFKVFYGDSCQVIELTYGRKNFVMDIILPHGKLSNYLKSFDGTEWQSLCNALDALSVPEAALISMPKFSFSYEKYLNDQLKVLGMTDAFDAINADLSGISDADIFVSFVKQNTFVDVNEEGTEAAAVTTVGVYVTSLPTTTEINKPFIFAIREQTTNTLMFIGKVLFPPSS
ncbi:MAG: serpin family protein [Bacteroidales bacterium]|jgi:serpin B|nr:serpin family protein [Bacteroidales bacterium]